MSVASRPMPTMFMTQPQPSGGFEWVQVRHKAGLVLRCAPLDVLAHHFVTTGSLQLRDDAAEWE